ncbi:hypothetical protein WBO52_04555 [Saccharothrix sp. CCNWLW140]|uniref:tetratricopeptide repeat protein n=1 Tax=Saccharothrix sp. CCNWLW140 TaxID=3128895 RepID=UPI00307DB3EE
MNVDVEHHFRNVSNSEITAAKIHLNVMNVAMGIDFVGDFRENVAPVLDTLPAGKPLLLVVDGLDEALRDAEPFVALVSAIGQAIDHSPHRDRGLGRLRLLVAGQPEVPLEVAHAGADRPVVVDLGSPHPSDSEALAAYTRLLLERVPADHRDRLTAQVVDKADGIWVWAYYVASAIADEVAAGGEPPANITTAAGLESVYDDAVRRTRDRVVRRPGASWHNGLALIGMVTAGQEISAPIPTAVVPEALGIGNAELALLLHDLRAVLAPDENGALRHFHGDFGRWVVAGGLEGADVRDAHERLAVVLTDLGRHDWGLAGSDTARDALDHATAAATLSAGQPSFARCLARCLDLLADRKRMSADSTIWLNHLIKVSALCSGDTLLPGTTVPLGGLAGRIQQAVTLPVGLILYAGMDADLVTDFTSKFMNQKGSDEAAGDWLDTNASHYREVVRSQVEEHVLRLWDGWRPPSLEAIAPGLLGEALLGAWERDRDPWQLNESINAYEVAVAASDSEHTGLIDTLKGLANGLVERIQADHRLPGDLDRLIEVEREVLERSEPTSRAATLSILAYWLFRRAGEQEATRSEDFDESIRRYGESLEQTAPDSEFHLTRLLGLARTLYARMMTEDERPGDLDRLIGLQQDILDRPGLDDRAQVLGVSGGLLRRRFARDGYTSKADIDEAVSLYELALGMSTEPDEVDHRTASLVNTLVERMQTDHRRPDDLDRAIELQRELAALRVGAPRAAALDVLGGLLCDRGRLGGEGAHADLSEAVRAYDEAVELDPRAEVLMGLSNALLSRIDLGVAEPGDLDRCIQVQRRLLDEVEPADRTKVLQVQASCLRERAQSVPSTADADLHQGISAMEEAVRITPPDHPDHFPCLVILSDLLIRRFNGDNEQPTDLDRLIEVQQAIVDASSAPGRALALAMLGKQLRIRSMRSPASAKDDLAKSIAVLEEALRLLPPAEVPPDVTADLANSHWRGFVERVPGATVDRAVALARATTSGSGAADPVLPPLRRLAARHSGTG